MPACILVEVETIGDAAQAEVRSIRNRKGDVVSINIMEGKADGPGLDLTI